MPTREQLYPNAKWFNGCLIEAEPEPEDEAFQATVDPEEDALQAVPEKPKAKRATRKPKAE